MDKQALIRDMKQAAGGASFITVSQVTNYLGLKNNSRVKKEYLADLDRVGKMYYIPDVCQSLMDKRRAL